MKIELNHAQAEVEELKRENNMLRDQIENESHSKENLMIEIKAEK